MNNKRLCPCSIISIKKVMIKAVFGIFFKRNSTVCSVRNSWKLLKSVQHFKRAFSVGQHFVLILRPVLSFSTNL